MFKTIRDNRCHQKPDFSFCSVSCVCNSPLLVHAGRFLKGRAVSYMHLFTLISDFEGLKEKQAPGTTPPGSEPQNEQSECWTDPASSLELGTVVGGFERRG